MSRRLQLVTILVILLTASALRIAALSRLPPGFSDEEINMVLTSATVRQGTLASFYNVGDPFSGREGLFPVLQAAVTTVIGEGLFAYRILPVWCGLLSVALMYALARRLFGYFPAIVAAISITILIWPLILARSSIREALLLPLILGILLTFTRAIHLDHEIEPGLPSTIIYAALGVLLSAIAYTQWSGLLALPIILVFLAYCVLTHQPISRRVIGYAGFSVLVMAILNIPYLTFSLRAIMLSGIRVFWSTRPANVGQFINVAVKSLTGIFFGGDPSPAHGVQGSALLGPVLGLLMLIGCWTAIRRWRKPNMALVLMTLGFGLLPGIWSRVEVDFTRMIIALPALVMLAGIGAEAIRRRFWGKPGRTWQPLLITVAGAVVGILMAYNGLFIQWANDSAVESAYRARLGKLAIYLDRTRDSLSTSICTFKLQSHTGAGQLNQKISDPALFDFMTHRRDLDLRFSDCLSGLVLTRGGATQRFAFADVSARDVIPPPLKEWLKDARPVAVPGLADGTLVTLNVEKPLADVSGKATMSQVEWPPEVTDVDSRAVKLPVRMGGYLTFGGYFLAAGTAYKPGDVIDVVTYWRADGAGVPPDLRLFVHVLNNPNTEPVIQNDILSVDAASLADRDVFIQIIRVPLPADLPANSYILSIGAYRDRDPNKTRLPIFDASNQRADRLFLTQIVVQ